MVDADLFPAAGLVFRLCEVSLLPGSQILLLSLCSFGLLALCSLSLYLTAVQCSKQPFIWCLKSIFCWYLRMPDTKYFILKREIYLDPSFGAWKSKIRYPLHSATGEEPPWLCHSLADGIRVGAHGGGRSQDETGSQGKSGVNLLFS